MYCVSLAIANALDDAAGVRLAELPRNPKGSFERSKPRREAPSRMVDMAAARTITFKLNGAQVSADVQPHHNLVEMLQTQLGLKAHGKAAGKGCAAAAR
jgi:hypothetical protein